ncbi:MAG: universal stress protein [Nitrospirota bacterium]|nr:universal stress protein [Nitrospirota bacterium]MDE3119207.1 universal stress protein [Nitrospirota bacterium]MDE3243461.1 universal stress protein [Nitrospirota bacterium]
MKIVLAVDGSKYSRWATEWLGYLPLRAKAQSQTQAFHVLDLAALRAPFMVQPVVIGNEPFIHDEIRRMETRAKQVVADTTSQLASLRIPAKVRSVNGPVAPTLLKQAGRQGLVVLGSRGMGALDRFMLGSVSTQVTQHAPCSVLVVKQPPRPIRRILLATDGSKPSEKAVRFLLREIRPQATGHTVEVLAMHVMPFMKYPELKEAGKALVHRDAVKLAKAGYDVEEICQLGQPADEIMKVADHRKVDLIVSGAKGLGAVARFLLGSVSSKLVQHSTCSILVVR